MPFAKKNVPIATIAALAGVSAGFLPALYGAIVMVGGLVLVLTVANPAVGLAILAIAVPLSPSGVFDRLPVAPTDLLVVALLVTVLGSRLATRRLALDLTAAFWPGVAFITALVLSASVAPDIAVSAKEVVRWVELLGVLIVAATYCQRTIERRLLTIALLTGLTAESLLGWLQFLLRRGPDGFRIGSFLRAYGTFGQPNPFAGYLVMTLPIALGVILWVRIGYPERNLPPVLKSRFLALGSFVAASVGVVALLMSLSRGALLGLAGSSLVLFVLYTKRGGAVVGGILTAVLLLAFLASSNLIPLALSDRISEVWGYVGWFDAGKVAPTPDNWAIVERMAHWQAGWNMYYANPVLGVGPGHYALAYPDYRVNDFWKDPLGHAHNLYLNVMAEDGFLGIVTYLIQLVAWIGVALAAFRRSRDNVDRAFAAGVVASIAGVAIHNLFDNLSVHGLGVEVGILVGMAAAIQRVPPTDRTEIG